MPGSGFGRNREGKKFYNIKRNIWNSLYFSLLNDMGNTNNKLNTGTQKYITVVQWRPRGLIIDNVLIH
jgi:hypothetical protein